MLIVKPYILDFKSNIEAKIENKEVVSRTNLYR